jgi:hypothetical protein
LSSTLNGTQEVPPNASTAIGSAFGTLTGDFGSNNFIFTYSLNFSGLTAPLTVGHIHSPALPGVNAGVAHDLDNLPIGSTNGSLIGNWRWDDTVRPLTETRAQQLIGGLAYFNLHNGSFPAGEIRGQITVVPESSNLAGLGLLAIAGLGWIAKKKFA